MVHPTQKAIEQAVEREQRRQKIIYDLRASRHHVDDPNDTIREALIYLLEDSYIKK